MTIDSRSERAAPFPRAETAPASSAPHADSAQREWRRLLAAAAVFALLTVLWVQLTPVPFQDTVLRPRFVVALLLLSYALAPWANAALEALGRLLHVARSHRMV